MKRLKTTILLLIIFSMNAFAQYEMQIKHDAEAIVEATINSDFKTIAKYTHPMVIERLGGYEKMIEVMANMTAKMKNQGSLIKQGIIGDPSNVVKGGDDLYSIVPEKLILELNGKKFYTMSSLLAVSPDNGEKWYFIDIGSMSKEQIKQYFSEVYSKLIIPEHKGPIEIIE